MKDANTVWEVLGHGADTTPAIGAPERKTLDYAGLRALAQKTVAALNGLGIGRGDRVAIVLPNGPEMATAFLTIACGATTAPLNPDYRAEEFEFYLSDLGAKALVVERGSASPAIAVARKLGVPVLKSPGRRTIPPAASICPQAPAAKPAKRRHGGAGRRGAGAAHVGHHVAAQDRAADPGQPRRLGAPHRRDAGAHARRPLPQHHAAVPHPRPDRGRAVVDGRGRERVLLAGLQRAQVLRLAR